MLSNPTAWRELRFVSLINIRANFTHTPATTNDYESGLLADALVFWVFYVAEECGNDGKVLWTSCFGLEGQRRDGDFIDMGLAVGEGVVDEDSASDECNAQYGGCCRVTGPAQEQSRAVEKRSRGRPG